MDLNVILQEIDVQADWIGLREVKETATVRAVRDGHPQANMAETTQGLMVEVLADGQFSYFGTNSMDMSSVQHAAELAVKQVIIFQELVGNELIRFYHPFFIPTKRLIN